MQFGYFKTASRDIKESPGWLKKMCLLALLNFIPIFGQIVTYGYLYGWARDIAWGNHSPMPARIFGNEDGKLYSRGFFILLVGIVYSLVIVIPYFIFSAIAGVGAASSYYGDYSYAASLASLGIAGSLFSLVITVLGIAISFFYWVASMRVSIYGTISSGFQLGKIWNMLKHDFGGILRIFGMSLLIGLIVGLIVSVVVFVGIFIVAGVGLAASGGSYSSGSYDTSSMVGLIVTLGFAGLLLILVFSFIVSVIGIWISALVARALGYWTRQFDVPNWKSQDAPMPFELNAMPSGQVPPSAQQPYGQPPAPQGQPVQPVQQPEGQTAPPVWEQPPVQQPAQEQASIPPASTTAESVSEPSQEDTQKPEQPKQPEQSDAQAEDKTNNPPA